MTVHEITTVRRLARAGTPPSEQIVTMLRRAAWKALDSGLAVDESYELVAEVLLSLGYQPPVDAAIRWRTLLGYLTDFQRWSEAGPDHDETEMAEDDWLAMITGELVAIAGRPL